LKDEKARPEKHALPVGYKKIDRDSAVDVVSRKKQKLERDWRTKRKKITDHSQLLDQVVKVVVHFLLLQ
jgi:hypothetical protein